MVGLLVVYSRVEVFAWMIVCLIQLACHRPDTWQDAPRVRSYSYCISSFSTSYRAVIAIMRLYLAEYTIACLLGITNGIYYAIMYLSRGGGSRRQG